MITIGIWMADPAIAKLLLAPRNPTAASPPYCLSHGWSIVTSAATNSTFAGALAGFVFLGVATLIARRDQRNAQALGLLSCAFVVLGFDSYLFSLVTGSGTDTLRARLGRGSSRLRLARRRRLAVVTGVTWLLAVREGGGSESGSEQKAAANTASESGSPALQAGVGPEVHLDTISRFMAVLVAVGIALLLASTTLDYGAFAFRGRENFRLDALSWTSLGFVVVASLGLTAYRHFHKSGRVPTIAYWMSSYGLVIYAVACTVFVGYITNTSAGQSFVGVTAAVLGSIAPSILLICLVQSIAPSFRASDEPRLEPEQAPPGDPVPVTAPSSG